MPAVSAALVLEIGDQMSLSLSKAKGASDATSATVTGVTGFGTGDSYIAEGSDWGTNKIIYEIVDAIIETADADVITLLLQSFNECHLQAPIEKYVYNVYNRALHQLNFCCRRAGVELGISSIVGLDSFLTYYNTGAGGPYTALMSMGFATAYAYGLPGQFLSTNNIYTTPKTGVATRTIVGGVPGSLTADAAITAQAGYARIQGVVTGFSGSTGNVAVGVAGLNASGAAATETINVSVTGNGTFSITGATVKVFREITSITFPGSITNATFRVDSLVPAATGGYSRPSLPGELPPEGPES